jgi:hypothetical protein
MLWRIGRLSLASWLAAVSPGLAAESPPPAEAVAVLHDLHYREGPSKQWRLDLAMKKGPRGRPRPAVVIIHGGWLEGEGQITPAASRTTGPAGVTVPPGPWAIATIIPHVSTTLTLTI